MKRHFRHIFFLFLVIIMLSSCGSEEKAPNSQTAESYTPTPEFWEEFDKDGITEEMKASSVHQGENCAQYLNFFS